MPRRQRLSGISRTRFLESLEASRMPDWTAIYERHSTDAWRTAYRILRDQHAAADCVQETFLAVMTLSTASPIRDWRGLVVSIAARRALDALRSRCRSQRRNAGVDLTKLPGLGVSPEETVATAELADQLRRAIAQLPVQQAEVFCLRCFSEMSHREIANELALEESHVGVLLYRARQALQHRLRELQPVAAGESAHDR
jgi:RNA polymerase sigma-70 factor, ECF subfamily